MRGAEVTSTMREALAEFLGTFVLILFGVGVVAQVTLGGGATGQYLSINLAWGLAVTLGVYVSAGVSGAHLNPAVTLALAAWRGFPWAKVGPYIGAQMAGAFVASAVVYLTYIDALAHFDGGARQVTGALGTAGIWATYPQPWLSTLGGLIDQIVGTAALVTGDLCALGHPQHGPAVQPRADRRRTAGCGDRHDVRAQRGLCHQPGARLRAAPVHRACRMGRRGVQCR